ncbi:hypothetical protein OGAPHI_006012 [Ogataea philodendri]|uniref:Uncharacterized protein n=1 Tax=Ogataea philodendri TaxID=1378263 RepID=A0A9P8T147_9ASCO|nr:uncharacterized protein OGAPHI_006012 [Ogataea philodendri]KAH3661834.1 hypothetical protein OGAPHI_006012 [Ogataea philodendri]
MTSRSRHDVRRQLFRGITTRISSHNYNGAKEEDKEQITTQQSTQPRSGDGSRRGVLRGTSEITPTLATKSNVMTLTPSNTYSSTSLVSGSTDINGTDVSDKVSLRQKSEADMDQYDYKTFSTIHPLRLSKIRAFEQAEMAHKMYFAKDEDIERKKNCMIVQVPGLTLRESRELSVDAGFGENDSQMEDTLEYGVYEDDDSDEDETSMEKDDPFVSADKRLRIMKNALRPVTEEQLVAKKLKRSPLNTVFQTSPQFLKDLDLQELELWELMNEEFEKEMESAGMDSREAAKRETQMTFLDTPLDSLSSVLTPEYSTMVFDGLRRVIRRDLDRDSVGFNVGTE